VKDFSIFEYALKFSEIEQTENLGEISNVSRRDFDERETFLCRTTTPSVEYACLMIENALLLRTNRSGRVYAGFEKLSCLEPIMERYLRIADVSESVYVFGEDDWQPPRHPNMRVVKLPPELSLAREWFLIADCSNYHAALVAAAEEGFDVEKADQRIFTAFKSSNPGIVAQLAKSAEGMIDWSFAA